MAGTPPGVQKITSYPSGGIRAVSRTLALCPPRNKFSKTTTASRSSRRLHCIERKKVICRLAAHLRQVDRTQRAPPRSLLLIVSEMERGFPPGRPYLSRAFVRRGGLFFLQRNLHRGSTGRVSSRCKLIALDKAEPLGARPTLKGVEELLGVG